MPIKEQDFLPPARPTLRRLLSFIQTLIVSTLWFSKEANPCVLYIALVTSRLWEDYREKSQRSLIYVHIPDAHWMIPPMSQFFSTAGKVKLTSPIKIIWARADINRSSYVCKPDLLVTASDLPLSCSAAKARSTNMQAFLFSWNAQPKWGFFLTVCEQFCRPLCKQKKQKGRNPF